jgi:hypothetical protein
MRVAIENLSSGLSNVRSVASTGTGDASLARHASDTLAVRGRPPLTRFWRVPTLATLPAVFFAGSETCLPGFPPFSGDLLGDLATTAGRLLRRLTSEGITFAARRIGDEQRPAGSGLNHLHRALHV